MLYLLNSENIYFPQIKEYFREIISSYDNGNYRSAMVMLYSTIVCDLLLKLQELSDVYSDSKAERILQEVNKRRKEANKSAWEWNFIQTVYEDTELLDDESYTMICHIYDLRNFSAHPALTEEYKLIAPSSELTVAYIKQALESIFIKQSVFAQNIVDRMSEDIASKKEIYKGNYKDFKNYLQKAYFQRMSEKMMIKVFRAFWKFSFIKLDENPFAVNRYINSRAVRAMLDSQEDILIEYVNDNKSLFSVSQDNDCLRYVCLLLSVHPKLYSKLDSDVQYQIKNFEYKDIDLYKWFIVGDLKRHIESYRIKSVSLAAEYINGFKVICESQGQFSLFINFILKYYAQSGSFNAARDRFDTAIEPYLEYFTKADLIEIIEIINNNKQIYKYIAQRERNDKIMQYAKKILPSNFDFNQYTNFKLAEVADIPKEDIVETESEPL